MGLGSVWPDVLLYRLPLGLVSSSSLLSLTLPPAGSGVSCINMKDAFHGSSMTVRCGYLGNGSRRVHESVSRLQRHAILNTITVSTSHHAPALPTVLPGTAVVLRVSTACQYCSAVTCNHGCCRASSMVILLLGSTTSSFLTTSLASTWKHTVSTAVLLQSYCRNTAVILQ